MNTDEVILFPDAGAEALTYLRAQLAEFGDPAAVARTVPNPRPARLVTVNVAAGLRLDLIRYQSRLVVECWDTLEQDARDLAALCYGLLVAMPGRHDGATVYRADEAGGLVPLPDPDTDAPRWTFAIALTFRGVAR